MSVYADKTYRKRQAALKRLAKHEGLTCWLCGKPFDWTIDNYLHPQAFTANHVDAIGNGGRLIGDLKAAHLRGDCDHEPQPKCNGYREYWLTSRCRPSRRRHPEQTHKLQPLPAPGKRRTSEASAHEGLLSRRARGLPPSHGHRPTTSAGWHGPDPRRGTRPHGLLPRGG